MALGFKHPFTCTIAGPTQCGKTVFVQKLLKALPYYVTPTPDRIVWAYGAKNETQFDNIQKSVSPRHIEFIDFIPSISDFSSDEKNLLIIDDLMGEVGRNKSIADLFTKGCHHQNISIILILQNLFHQGVSMRDIHSSTNYLVLFNNPRDCSQVMHVQRQSFPHTNNFLVDAYKDACSKPHGYLIIDFHQSTPSKFRVCTDIFPPDVLKVYSQKNSK